MQHRMQHRKQNDERLPLIVVVTVLVIALELGVLIQGLINAGLQYWR
jgi:hypothetical protein